jgi:hypothetical protein
MIVRISDVSPVKRVDQQTCGSVELSRSVAPLTERTYHMAFTVIDSDARASRISYVDAAPRIDTDPDLNRTVRSRTRSNRKLA